MAKKLITFVISFALFWIDSLFWNSGGALICKNDKESNQFCNLEKIINHLQHRRIMPCAVDDFFVDGDEMAPCIVCLKNVHHACGDETFDGEGDYFERFCSKK